MLVAEEFERFPARAFAYSTALAEIRSIFDDATDSVLIMKRLNAAECPSASVSACATARRAASDMTSVAACGM